MTIRWCQTFGIGRDNARHGGSVGPLAPRFVLGGQEKFLLHVAGEQRVRGVDPGVHEPDRHARARDRGAPLEEFEIRVGLGRVDRGQAPLVLEVRLVRVQFGNAFLLLAVLGLRQAAERSSRKARIGRRVAEVAVAGVAVEGAAG